MVSFFFLSGCTGEVFQIEARITQSYKFVSDVKDGGENPRLVISEQDIKLRCIEQLSNFIDDYSVECVVIGWEKIPYIEQPK